MAKSSLAWKFLLIAVVIVLALYFSSPPDERIKLGLDLQGGAHILMQVELGSAVRYELGQTQQRIGVNLSDENLTYDSILVTDDNTLEVRGTDPAHSAEVREVISGVVQRWTITSPAEGDYRMVMPSDLRAFVEKDAVETTLETLRNRIDGLGVSDPLVQPQGTNGDRILVQLPGVTNLLDIKDILKNPAILEWKEVTFPPGLQDPRGWGPPATKEEVLALFGGTLPDDTELIVQKDPGRDGSLDEIWWPLKRVSTVAGADLRNAWADVNQWNEPTVNFELTQDAGRRFENATKKNVGRRMAIVLGDARFKQVLSAPSIKSVIRDTGYIEGGFTRETADMLALQLRSGAFPTEVTIIEERMVGPSLGHDSIAAGLVSGIAGFLGVMLFMLVYYRLAGVNAAVALALNVLLVFGCLGALPFFFSGARATLTLPGIAGLVLTVGLAVDSNVLIFERIREELRMGKTVRSAVEQGFGRAFMTILDCNVTTLVSAFFLFSYGTGPVRGFAVTLTIGLFVSMFTAVFISRQIFELVLNIKGRNESLSI
jgi:preprotein translocase subunit SecD